MWRGFIIWGVSLIVLGAIVAVAAGARSVSVVTGVSTGAAAAAAIGMVMAIVGGMLLNAGLIGAAVGADPRTHAKVRESAVSSGAFEPSGESGPASSTGISGTYNGLGARDNQDSGGAVPHIYSAWADERPRATATARTTRRCAQCGKSLDSGASFCGSCGAASHA